MKNGKDNKNLKKREKKKRAFQAGNEISMWKIYSLFQKKSNIPIIKDEELRLREFCTSRPCWNNSYFPLASPHGLVTFSQLSLFSQPNIATLDFAISLSPHSWRLMCHVKFVLDKLVYFFSCLSVLSQFNSKVQLKITNWVKVEFRLPCTINQKKIKKTFYSKRYTMTIKIWWKRQ